MIAAYVPIAVIYEVDVAAHLDNLGRGEGNDGGTDEGGDFCQGGSSVSMTVASQSNMTPGA